MMDHFEFTKGNHFLKDTGIEKILEEGFQRSGDRISAQVSARNIKKVFENYMAYMDKEDDMYFFIRLPYRNDEEDQQGTGVKMYYLDHLNPYHAMRILDVFGEVLINDGVSSFGFGTEDSEIEKGECNRMNLWMEREDVFPETIFTILSIPQKKGLIFAETLSCDDNPIVSQNYYDEDGRSIYNVIASLEEAGLYEAKPGEEQHHWKEKEAIDRYNFIRIVLDQPIEGENGITSYHEELILQRKGEKAWHIRRLGDLKVNAAYEFKDLIAPFLDSLSDDLFSEVEGNPPDTVFDSSYYASYTIHLEKESGEARDIEGTFDKRGLPSDWPAFTMQLSAVIHAMGMGTIFDLNRAMHPLRRKNELIFYYVTFHEDGPEYCYLSDTEDYRPGDEVIVPTGDDNRETIAVVDHVEYHTKRDAPYPLKKIKKIIRAHDGTPLGGEGEFARYLHHGVVITAPDGNMISGFVAEYFPEGEEHPWGDGLTDECLCLILPGKEEELFIFHTEDIVKIALDD